MDINDLKKTGVIIDFNNEPYQIIFSQHSKTARGRAFVRTKMKNLLNGQILEKTFNSSDKIKGSSVDKSKACFLYQKENHFFFMDNHTYEQFFLDKKSLSGQEKFLKEGLEVDVILYNKKPINIELPKKIDLKVIEAPPGIKGDSATSPSKTIVLETGLKINAPIFIKENDLVRINTNTGEYVERV
jgi:elongation factor P